MGRNVRIDQWLHEYLAHNAIDTNFLSLYTIASHFLSTNHHQCLTRKQHQATPCMARRVLVKGNKRLHNTDNHVEFDAEETVLKLEDTELELTMDEYGFRK
jgi:hypothetical protein